MSYLTYLKEQFAAQEHERWSGWMRHLFDNGILNDDGTFTIPQWAVARWQRQMNTPYADLSESEKDSDRAEAEKILSLMPINLVADLPAYSWPYENTDENPGIDYQWTDDKNLRLVYAAIAQDIIRPLDKLMIDFDTATARVYVNDPKEEQPVLITSLCTFEKGDTLYIDFIRSIALKRDQFGVVGAEVIPIQD